MNPLTNIKNLQKLNERELELGNIGKRSWHDEYKDSAWVFIGGLPYDLTEGDVICVFSQYGEVVNLNLIRDHKTGKTKGYGFLCYEDQRSTVLAVDNLNGIKILSRTIRVDHVKDYKIPKEHGDEDELTLKIRNEGCAPQLPSSSGDEEEEKADTGSEKKATKQNKNDKKKMKNKKKRKKSASISSSDSSDSDEEEDRGRAKVEIKIKLKSEKGSEKIKLEKSERGYGDPYSSSQASGSRQREDKQRTKVSNSRTDIRDRLERNARDRLDGSDDDDGRRDRGRNEKRREIGYRGDRYAANGSHSRDEFDDRFGTGSSRRDRSSERYGNTSRAWDNDTDSGRMRQRDRSWERQSDRSWERQGRSRQEDWRFDRRGDR